MYRKRILFPLGLCCLAMPLWAKDAQQQTAVVPLSCGTVIKLEPSFYEPVKARNLTREEQRDLRKLFSRVAGEWRGRMVEDICMLSGATRHRRYDSSRKARVLSDGLELRGDDVRTDVRSKKHHTRRFYITPDGLRVDTRSRAGEVELLEAGDRVLSFLRHYRTARRNPAQSPQGAVGTAAQQTADAGDGTGVTGGSGDQTAPRTNPGSVAHEERYSLQLVGPNELTVTQQFISQGIYSGSMTWHLRRD
jgi:hypothetical protein